MSELWQSELELIWRKALMEVGCSSDLWKIRRDDDTWVVVDSRGRTVLQTPHENLALVCQSLPELIDQESRPGEVLKYVDIEDGNKKPVPPSTNIGVVSTQQAYDKGFTDGYDQGSMQSAVYSRLGKTNRDAF